MKKILFALSLVIILLTIGFFALNRNLEIGGGGADQFAPDTIQSGTSATVQLIVKVWGQGGSISGRFTNLSLHYRLVGDQLYTQVNAVAAPLPEQYKTANNSDRQHEAYTFTILPYHQDTRGEVEYYIEITFDGVTSRAEGIKRIQVTE